MAPQSNKKGVNYNTIVTGYGRIIPPHRSYISLADTNRYMATSTLGRNNSLLSFQKGIFSRR